MTGFTMIDMVILIAYLGLVLLAGLHFSKKDMKGKNILKVMELYHGGLHQFQYLRHY